MRLLLILVLLTPVIVAFSVDEELNNADGANAASFTADQEVRHKRNLFPAIARRGLDVELKSDGCPKYCPPGISCCFGDNCATSATSGKMECLKNPRQFV
uniref:Teretoxin Tsu6.4 n=1 Tax=Terebra subulata TaxID=89435 RepID=T64_TERSU|nr:RecName: Full=Teretoxin Tsu6.4; Flags: Precursor [Terebra subulata]